MWQKCPICNGSGISPDHLSTSTCPTCQGKRIISEINGLPPASLSSHISPEYTGTDFRDANMESQDEYFGRK